MLYFLFALVIIGLLLVAKNILSDIVSGDFTPTPDHHLTHPSGTQIEHHHTETNLSHNNHIHIDHSGFYGSDSSSFTSDSTSSSAD
jgi:hypothetical protein